MPEITGQAVEMMDPNYPEKAREKSKSCKRQVLMFKRCASSHSSNIRQEKAWCKILLMLLRDTSLLSVKSNVQTATPPVEISDARAWIIFQNDSTSMPG